MDLSTTAVALANILLGQSMMIHNFQNLRFTFQLRMLFATMIIVCFWNLFLESSSAEEKGEELLLALKKTRPKIIFQGEYLESLSPEVRDYLGFYYRTHHSEPTLLIRK